MSLETLLEDRLDSDATVSSLSGGNVNPLLAKVKQGDPYVTYEIEKESLRCAAGRVTNKLTQARVTVRCVATTHKAALTLAEAVKARIDGWSSSPTIHSVTYTGSTPDAERESDGSENTQGTITQTYDVWFIDT